MKKRIISLLLTLCMVLTLLPTAAFAAEEKFYVALGDSISTGYGLSDKTTRFSDLVAAGKGYTQINYAVDGNTISKMLESQLLSDVVVEDIAKADLITVTVGGNDLLAPVFELAAERYNAMMNTSLKGSEVTSFIQTATMVQKLLMIASFCTVLEGDASSGTEPYIETDTFAASMAELEEDITTLMGEIRALNPRANVVLCSQYHPYRSFAEVNVALGEPLDECVLAFRTMLLDNAEELGYFVADVYTAFKDEEVKGTKLCNSDPDTMEPDFHPNKAGHALIAETILALELPEVPEYTEPPEQPEQPEQPEHTHAWELCYTIDPWCEEEGMNYYLCAGCGEEWIDPIPATGHLYDSDYDGDCNNCGATREVEAEPDEPETPEQPDEPETPEHTHSWGSGTVTTEPTCKEKGVKTYTCSCGETKTESIAAKGHTYSSSSDTTCNTCGEKRTVSSGGSSSGSSSSGSSSGNGYCLWAVPGVGGSISPSGVVVVAPGRDKTFTIKADKGYAIADVKVNGKSVGAVTEYTFKDVEKNAKIQVSFKLEKCDGGASCPSRKYKDLNVSAEYHEAVDAMILQGLMKGTGSATFSPDVTLTRAMLVVMLYRMEGEPKVASYWRKAAFEDVKSGSWYADAIAWAYAKEIVSGYSDTAFAPDQTVSREQMVTILYRYAKYSGMDVSVGSKTGSLKYQDSAKVSSYAVVPMEWAVGKGAITPRSGDLLAPAAGASRTETAQALYAMMTMI